MLRKRQGNRTDADAQWAIDLPFLYAQASMRVRSKVDPMKDVVKIIRSHLEGNVAWARTRQLSVDAHASICFMALILYRVMHSRLKAGESHLSPERALAKLRRIQHQKTFS